MKNASHILLVDDEPLVLNSMRDLLEVDYVVHTADNGQKALEILSKHPIKVLITDERMPQMRGHQLLKRAKQISPNTIRILLTGYADLESVMNSVNAGEIFRYLNKPCRNDALLNVVRLGVQIYDRLSALNPAINAAAKDDSKSDLSLPKYDALFIGFTPDEVARLQLRLSKQFTIRTAPNAQEALQIIAQFPPDVIVSELKLDDYEGIDFLKAVLAENPQLIIIVLTETVDVGLITQAVNELNVFRYLPKPASQEDLERALMDAAAKSAIYRAQPNANLRVTASQIQPPTNQTSATDDLLGRLKSVQDKLKRQ
ncbi:MAG: response regulator [Chloroherpetonaceae bacterium]|nr:response regulator [Chloroherpetonaceae bacterium]MDW8437456.1 response regulator [Chloroherpetonaceae bacterium]